MHDLMPGERRSEDATQTTRDHLAVLAVLLVTFVCGRRRDRKHSNDIPLRRTRSATSTTALALP